MNQLIAQSLSKTGKNVLRTGATLIVSTIVSSHLKDVTQETISSSIDSYNKIKQSFMEKKQQSLP